MFSRTTRLLFWLFASFVLALPAFSSPITVQSVLFDCDGDVLTVGPLYGTSGNCSSPMQNGTADGSGSLVNGDFTILEFETDPSDPIGDGIDEWTRGIFDFRSDAAYSDFSNLLAEPHGKIFAATLSLVLTPRDFLFTTDQFNLENSTFIGSPQISDLFNDPANPLLSNNISKIVTLDLLNFYSQQQLENYLSGGIGDFVNDGRILLTYGDDAIVSGAALRITANIPEPGTLALFSLGLLSVFAVRRRKLKNG
ncbi:MAG: PEP-CTERM sorting domain-containing protein [Gammaproteobacteria bacterium]|nr:PEP-CTERM sorting domain-containing protein [Gammaproteobacteria bacterium]